MDDEEGAGFLCIFPMHLGQVSCVLEPQLDLRALHQAQQFKQQIPSPSGAPTSNDPVAQVGSTFFLRFLLPIPILIHSFNSGDAAYDYRLDEL